LGWRVGRKFAAFVVVQEILAATQDREERLRRWKQLTNKSQATFYHRLQELAAVTEGNAAAG
jgi:hypothetical protein